MGFLGDWIILTPLVPALLVLVYTGWQAYKEVKPTLKEVNTLKLEILKTREAVQTLMVDVQSTKARAMEQAEVVQGLIADSRDTYGKVREVMNTVVSMDTLTVRQGIAYWKHRREDRRLQEKVSYLKDQARKLNAKLDGSDFSQFPALLSAIFSATALIYVLRRSGKLL